MDQLLICLSYQAQPKLLETLFESIASSECQLIDMNLSSIGSNYQTITLILTGSWNQLTRFKTRLSALKEHYTITSTIQEINASTYPADALPYEAYITMPAYPKSLHQAICFFSSLPFTIHKLSIVTYQAPLTQARMLELSLVLIAGSNQSIHDHRENILQFCDDHSFEVILESKRT